VKSGNNSTLYMLLYVIYWYDVMLMYWLWWQEITVRCTYCCTSYVSVRLCCWTDCEIREYLPALHVPVRHILVWCYTDGLTVKPGGITALCTWCSTSCIGIMLYWWTDCEEWVRTARSICCCSSYVGRYFVIVNYLNIFSLGVSKFISFCLRNAGYFYYY
jgi:hypothetical protein